MHINNLPEDCLQKLFGSTLKASESFEEGCQTIASISHVCKKWQKIIYFRIEPIQAFYNKFFAKPLHLTDEQLVQSNKDKDLLHKLHRLSIGFYFGIKEEQRFYESNEFSEMKLVPVFNNDIHETKNRFFWTTNVTETFPEPRFVPITDEESLTKNHPFAQMLMKKENLPCLQMVLRSGVNLIQTDVLDEVDDFELDPTLDLFLTAFKKAAFCNLWDSEERAHVKETLILLIQDVRFTKHQSADFFWKFKDCFYDRPDTFLAIGLWKVMEEINPKNCMLNPEYFFDFLLICESQDAYTSGQLEEINLFVKLLLDRISIHKIRFLEESVHHSFFPLVFDLIANKWEWYELFFEKCLEKTKLINLKNAECLLQDPDAILPEGYFRLAIANNLKIAILLLDDECVDLSMSEWDFRISCQTAYNDLGLQPVLEFKEKLLASHQISKNEIKKYEKVLNTLLQQKIEQIEDVEMMDAGDDMQDLEGADFSGFSDTEEPPAKKQRKE